MKLSQLKQYEGQCCPDNLIKSQTNNHLHCVICLQTMVRPISLSCPSRHTFGMFCLKLWTKNKQQISCPVCRCKVNSWTEREELQKQLQEMKAICQYCKKWQGSLGNFNDHENMCEYKIGYLKEELSATIGQEIKQLEIQINPHLKSQHEEIFEKYVENWRWLSDDSRDWKWWWWCNNPWWGGVACLECNRLWHKYERKIDLIEVSRVNLINRIDELSGRVKDKQSS